MEETHRGFAELQHRLILDTDGVAVMASVISTALSIIGLTREWVCGLQVSPPPNNQQMPIVRIVSKQLTI